MWLTYEIGLSLQSFAPFADLIFQKCSGPFSFVTISCDQLLDDDDDDDDDDDVVVMKLGSRYCRVRLLPTSSSKSAPNPFSFLTFSSGNRAFATVSWVAASLVPPILSRLCPRFVLACAPRRR